MGCETDRPCGRRGADRSERLCAHTHQEGAVVERHEAPGVVVVGLVAREDHDEDLPRHDDDRRQENAGRHLLPEDEAGEHDVGHKLDRALYGGGGGWTTSATRGVMAIDEERG